MTQQMWGPALEAEVAYRREMAAKSYQAGTPAPLRWVARVAVQGWRKGRTALKGRRGRWAAVGSRAREGAARFGDTLDTISARTDREAWEQRVAGRSAQIEHALEALRPQDGLGRRAA